MSDEIKDNLCHYDPDSTYYEDLKMGYEDDLEDMPKPRDNCSCDNCFYGRDNLAISLATKTRELEEANSRIKDLEAPIISCYMSRHVSQIRDLHEKDGVSQCWHEGQKIVDEIKKEQKDERIN